MIANGVPSQARRITKSRFGRTTLVVIILVALGGAVVATVAASLFLGPSLSVAKKNFTPYTTPVPRLPQSGGNRSSLTVSNTNGGVNVSAWSQSYLMINGTVTARGFGSSPDMITFVESNSSAHIVFQAIFPVSRNFFLSASYTVDIHVYEPAGYVFDIIRIATVNGDLQVSSIAATFFTLTDTNGAISASSVTSSNMTATDTNGSIRLTCTACGEATVTTSNGNVTVDLSVLSFNGSYLVATTYGDVNMTLPASASCRITPDTTNGTVSGSGLGVHLWNHTTAILGAGTAFVNLATTNGSITVTGQ
jgi:DUF4097 and DUF4098 domain-containing protein YvlB